MDKELRELERQSALTGDPADAARLRAARVRAGELDRHAGLFVGLDPGFEAGFVVFEVTAGQEHKVIRTFGTARKGPSKNDQRQLLRRCDRAYCREFEGHQ